MALYMMLICLFAGMYEIHSQATGTITVVRYLNAFRDRPG